MKFRFNKEGGHFTPKSMQDLIKLCGLKRITVEYLYFSSFEGNNKGEKFIIFDEQGSVIGFSDTDQFDTPPYDPEKDPVIIEFKRIMEERIKMIREDSEKVINILIETYKTN